MGRCESRNTIDLNEGDDNNESEGEYYDEDPIMDCNQVDDAAVVEIDVEGDGNTTIRVGPKTSIIKREWKQCRGDILCLQIFEFIVI